MSHECTNPPECRKPSAHCYSMTITLDGKEYFTEQYWMCEACFERWLKVNKESGYDEIE
jgi:hypothetical protein